MARPALMKAEQREYKDKKTGETRRTEHYYIRIDGKPVAALKPDGSKCYTKAEALAVLHAKLAEKHGAKTANAAVAAANRGELFYKDLRDLLFKYHRKEGSKSVRTLSNGEQIVQGITELDVFGGIKTKNEDNKYTANETKGRKVSTITENTWFDEFIVRRYREGVSAAVISHSAKALRHMLRLAKMDSVAKEIFVPTTGESREDCLYIEDFRRLIGQAGPAFIAKEFHPVLRFLFFQGVRVNETLSITWSQIDLEQGEFYPSKHANKTGDTSAKALNPVEVIPMLKKLKGNAKDSDYVFGAIRSAGKNPVKRLEGAFRNAMLEMKPVSGLGRNKGPAGPAWRCAMCKAVNRNLPAPEDATTAHVCTNKDSKLCQQYQVPMIYVYCGPSLHSLRASCAVYYLERGMVEVEVAKVTGHSDLDVLRGYLRMKNENIAAKMGAASQRRAS